MMKYKEELSRAHSQHWRFGRTLLVGDCPSVGGNGVDVRQ